MDIIKKYRAVILVAAMFVCGIAYLWFSNTPAGTDGEDVFAAGGTKTQSDVERGTTGSGYDAKVSDAGDGSATASGNDASGASDGTDGLSVGDGSSADVSTSSDGSVASVGTDNGSEIPGLIYVYVCGAVKNPGVYTFTGNPRVVEAVEAAGGFTKKADTTSVNLAGTLEDGAQVVIGEKSKDGTVGQTSGVISPEGGSGSAGTGNSNDGRIDLNTADLEELKTIPGIGDVKAAAIVSYRDTNGRFAKIEDVMNISGIKQGTFDKIKDYIKV